MITEPIPKTAWLFLSIALLTIVEAFIDMSWPAPATAALIVLFIAVEFKHIPRSQKIVGAILAGIGLAGAAASGQWQTIVPDAIARSRSFLLLFFAVSWLQFPVGRSPSFRAVRTALLNQPPGRRFLFLSCGVHCLGAVLNLAGLSLLSTVAREQKDIHLRRRLVMALVQGFTSASCWSPFYVSMIVVLVAIPTLKWRDVAPAGAILGAAIIMTGWLYDRYAIRQDHASIQKPTESVLSPLKILRAAIILSLLITSVMAVIASAGVSIPVALGLIGPPFAAAWIAAIDFRSGAAVGRAADLAGKVVGSLPSLRNETLVFVAANILGLGVASAVPAADLGSTINQIIPWADGRILMLFATFVACGFMGLHPVILVLFIGSVLPPEALGLRDWIVGAVYLGCWGLCTLISPFSGTTLFMSHQAGVPGYVIAWQWVSRSTLLQAVALFLIVVIIRHATL